MKEEITKILKQHWLKIAMGGFRRATVDISWFITEKLLVLMHRECQVRDDIYASARIIRRARARLKCHIPKHPDHLETYKSAMQDIDEALALLNQATRKETEV